jgi:hypothetical protein
VALGDGEVKVHFQVELAKGSVIKITGAQVVHTTHIRAGHHRVPDTLASFEWQLTVE